MLYKYLQNRRLETRNWRAENDISTIVPQDGIENIANRANSWWFLPIDTYVDDAVPIFLEEKVWGVGDQSANDA